MAVYTAGNMIGTGTHQTLIGLAQNGCGNMLWANFLLSGVLVTLSALPLLHLYHRFPTNDCLHQAATSGLGAVPGGLVAFVNGQLVTIELIFAVTMQAAFFGRTAASQFLEGGDELFSLCSKMMSLAVLAILWILYRKTGALFTANIAWALGVLELSTVGLLILSSPIASFAGTRLRPLGALLDGSQTDAIKFPSGIHFAIFAYGGFPGMIQSADLVDNPSRNVPLGIVVACVMTTCIYVVMSASVLLVSQPAAIASFQNGFDSLRDILPSRVLAIISCTVLSSVANNIMENALVVIENLTQMTATTAGSSLPLSLPNLGMCRADTFTFGAIAILTMFKSELGLGMLGDAIDFALLLQFAIFAILCISSKEASLGMLLVAVLSLTSNAVLAAWHLCHASALPMIMLIVLVFLPLTPSFAKACSKKTD
eukprot:TRINITY_DN57515_c0_g1_i1.p1 TRINITY_DN57515_c0_g1~~TRINITY_DN57515_c0_g1_i1.p1  ORF type:complete len:475 (+),score=85.80 TRINITY_DN57515_c0_g1_i1:147-1427(+)